MSVVMIRLMPPDTISVALQSGRLLNNRTDAFSIKAGYRGTVLIVSSVNRKTPVTISLFRVDGRTLERRVSTTLQKGNSTMILESDQGCNGVYIVRITGAEINVSKKIVLVI